MALDMMKSTFTNVLPMIAIGGWINWTFSGFLASELERECVYLVTTVLHS